MIFIITFKSIIKFITAHTLSFLLVFISILATSLGFLYVVNMLYHSYLWSADIYKETRTLTLSLDKDIDMNGSQQIYDLLMQNSEIPAILSLTFHSNNTNGLYEYREEPQQSAYGRFFTDEDYSNASRVAMIALKSCEGKSISQVDSLWEESITINHTHFMPIGYFYSYTDLTYLIPITTFIQSGFRAGAVTCIFQEKPSAMQMRHLKDALEGCKNVTSFTLPSDSEARSLNSFWPSVSAYAGFLLLSIVGALNIISFWINRNMPRLKVYALCGASNRRIIAMLLFGTATVVTIAYICAAITMHVLASTLLVDAFITPIPFEYLPLIGLLILTFTLGMTGIKLRSFVRRENLHTV